MLAWKSWVTTNGISAPNASHALRVSCAQALEAAPGQRLECPVRHGTLRRVGSDQGRVEVEAEPFSLGDLLMFS